MSLRKLTAFIVLFELIGIGVYFSFYIGMTYAAGGKSTLDMARFGEQHIEFFAMMVLAAVGPYALYVMAEDWP